MKKFMNLSIILLVTTMCAMIFAPSEAWGEPKKSLLDFGDAPPVATDKKADKKPGKDKKAVKDTRTAAEKAKAAADAKAAKDKAADAKAAKDKAAEDKAAADAKAAENCDGFTKVDDETTKDPDDKRCPNKKEQMKEALQELMTPEEGGPPRDENGRCPYGPFDNELVEVTIPSDGGVSPKVKKQLRPCNPFPKGVEETESLHIHFYLLFALCGGAFFWGRKQLIKLASVVTDFIAKQSSS